MTAQPQRKPDSQLPPLAQRKAAGLNQAAPLEFKVYDGQDYDPGSRMWKVAIYRDFKKLESSWRKLESQGTCTVFQTYDWVSCWYETALSYGQAEPLIVTISHEKTDIFWLLPLCIQRKKGMKIISFADLGLSNYTGPVIAPCAPSDPGIVRDMLKTVLKALPKCDLVHFQKLPEKIGDAANPLLQLPHLERFRDDCYEIMLTQPWSALKEKVMAARDRSNIRRRRKNLEKEGAYVLHHHRSAQTRTDHIDKLLTMQNKRFESVGRPRMPDFWQEFYRRLVKREDTVLFDICISTITVAGEPIASSLGVIQKNSYQGILSTFDGERWRRFSPGILLCDSLLDDFSKLTKSETGYFDFSTGDYPYKRSLGCQSHPLYEYMKVCRIRGLAPYLNWRVKTILRRRYPRFFALLKRTFKRAP